MTGLPYEPAEASGVWLHLEREDDGLAGVSRELLGKGRQLADALDVPFTAMLLGPDAGEVALEAVACGADTVLLAEHPLLELYTTDAHCAAVAQLVADGKPSILLLGATPDGRDLAGRLAVRLRTGLTADCTDLSVEPETGLLLGEVVGFGGGIVATVKCEQRRPQMATVRPGVFAVPSPDRSRRGTVHSVDVDIAETDIRTRVLERETGQAADITQSEILVVGGAGTGGDFRPLVELAGLIGADIGATRVAVDSGWDAHERQIGQTGYVTHPRLAIICGTSGASQFTVGIQEAETVVAVNIDGEAPIFEFADYGVVGDLAEVLPPLIEEVRSIFSAGSAGAS